ncbi:insulinase family protein [Pseudoalteromonas obscura]|uniref:Protease 3 n=1 Tax=Pseudoalteromonas obscura TaxID=3048491 RepID=A0ABT7EQL7_9GAMM|nr:insulinase family protein [Pseudoalteromonas sp. P94(2023)]MDK2597334.1 insulinase family protein [Pseudoalteromonas sp. P94(2023)]
MKKLMALGAISLGILTACSTTSFNNQPVQLISDQLVVSPNDDRAYKVLTLENGIDVVLVSDPSAEKSAAALSVGVGLLHDPMSQQGMAHYLEHMLFLGTEKFPDPDGYAEFVQNNGGANNAYTWLDVTNYMVKINNDAYDEALDRFSDFFKSAKLYPEYTDKEKNAVNAEWSMRREMDFFGQFKLARQLLGDHPSNRFLIGNLETLGDKKDSNLHQETVAFYNKYYSSNIMKLAMVSNMPLAEMEQKAIKHFSTIKNKNIAEPEVTKTIDFSEVGKKRIHYRPNQDVKALNVEFIIENNMSDFAVKPNYFVSYLLSNEMQGSPAQVLKEQGLISSLTANASPNHYGNYGALTIDVQLTDQGMQQRETIVATIMQYINLIKEQGVDSKYFEEIRTSLNNQFRFLEKSDEFSYVSTLAANMQDYPLTHAINANYHFAQFDPNAVDRVLQQLNSNTMRVWYISKDEPVDSNLHFYDGKYKVEPIGASEIESWSKPSQFALSLPSVNRLLPENFELKSSESKVVEKVYEGKRIHAWLKPSKRFGEQPKGKLEIVLNSALPLNDINTQVAANLWADLYEIEKAKLITEAHVAGMGLELSYANGLVMSVSGFTDKQPVLIEKALEGLAVTPNEKQLEQAIDRYVRTLQNKAKQIPYYQVFGAYRQVTREGSFDSEALIKAAKSMTTNDFKKAQGELLSNNLVRVFGYGNYNKQDITNVVSRLETHIGSEASQVNYVRAGFWQPKQGEVIVLQKDTDVADVAVIDVVVHPEPGYAQKAAALILKSHLRQKAFNILRTEEQLAYAVGAIATSIDEHSAIALFIQTPVKDVKSMQARFDAFKLEYAKELENLTAAEFEQIKASALANLREEPKNLAEEAQPILTDWYKNELSFDSKEQLIAAAERITMQDIKSYLHHTLLNESAPRLNIQLRGNKFSDKPFADLPNQKKISSLEDLYKKVSYE